MWPKCRVCRSPLGMLGAIQNANLQPFDSMFQSIDIRSNILAIHSILSKEQNDQKFLITNKGYSLDKAITWIKDFTIDNYESTESRHEPFYRDFFTTKFIEYSMYLSSNIHEALSRARCQW